MISRLWQLPTSTVPVETCCTQKAAIRGVAWMVTECVYRWRGIPQANAGSYRPMEDQLIGGDALA